MAKASTTTYGNDSISMLKGAERVRKRPSVIFGSDGLEGSRTRSTRRARDSAIL